MSVISNAISIKRPSAEKVEKMISKLEHSAELTKAKIADMVIRLHSVGCTKRAYEACVKSPSVRELGEAADKDVYAGIAFVIQKCILKGNVEMLHLADSAVPEEKDKILELCIPVLLREKYSDLAFYTASALSDTQKKYAVFAQILQYVRKYEKDEKKLAT